MAATVSSRGTFFCVECRCLDFSSTRIDIGDRCLTLGAKDRGEVAFHVACCQDFVSDGDVISTITLYTYLCCYLISKQGLSSLRLTIECKHHETEGVFKISRFGNSVLSFMPPRQTLVTSILSHPLPVQVRVIMYTE